MFHELIPASEARGMNFDTGVHDWLDFEAATADELHDRICTMGFVEKDRLESEPRWVYSAPAVMSSCLLRTILDDEHHARTAIAVHGRGRRGQQRTAGVARSGGAG